ncbi:MAG: hypothetical protein ACETWC_01130 [Acidobacteriota bacterium]
MLYKRVILMGVLAIFTAGALSLLLGQGVKVGNFTLPRDVEYSGKTIPQGVYQLSLETKGEDTYICIWKDKEQLSKEMAIIQEAKKNYPTPVIAVDVITQDEDQFVRISVFMERKVYKAFYKCV